MEFGTREILIVLGIIIILGILLDGLRRVRIARHGSLKVSRRKQAIFDDESIDDISGEFPIGEVRVTRRDERSAEALSDNIKRYQESVGRKCTSAYRDIAESRGPQQARSSGESGEKPAPAEEPAPEYVAEDSPGLDAPQNESPEAAPGAFAVERDEKSGDARAAEEGGAEKPWVATRDEPDFQLQQPFHIDERGDDDTGHRQQPAAQASAGRSSSRKPFWQEEPAPPEPRRTEPETRRTEPEAAAGAEDAGSGSGVGDVDVVIIHVMAKKDQYFDGSALLEALLAQGLRYGEMGIFHRHEKANGSGPIKFSLANSVKPGTFDIEHMDEFTTPGVTLFMPLENLDNPLDHFDQFVKTAQALAKSLKGELKDETRSVFTRQTVEHYRQQIIEYTRKSFTLSHN